uniref:Uncharacterized protein n=1 Tax=Percolomonas cosmopolitus TaxID=63605 RepID=A0A7S1KNX5_9EUKA
MPSQKNLFTNLLRLQKKLSTTPLKKLPPNAPPPGRIYHLLGYLMRHGIGTDKDLKQSLIFTEKAAKQYGSVEAMYALARFGNVAERRQWLEQAALAGHDMALLKLGEQQHEDALIEDAMTSLIRCARRTPNMNIRGRALYLLGNLFLERDEEFDSSDPFAQDLDEIDMDQDDEIQHIEQQVKSQQQEQKRKQHFDPKMAVKLFKEAIKMGNLDALCVLGDCYLQGLGLDASNAKNAFRLYLAAAEKGHGLGQYHTYRCLMEGIGTQSSEERAIEWLKKASDNGVVPAQCELASCYMEGEAGIEKNPEKAFNLFKQAAEANDADAQINLAFCYHLGLGCEKDETKASEWFHMAAMHGLPAAQFQVGYRYQIGRGCEKDASQAFQWYRKAADRGFVDAINEVGRCYEFALGCNNSPFKAFTYYNNAANQGHQVAMVNLAKCYIKGIGVSPNLAKALEICEQGAKNFEPAEKLKQHLKLLLRFEKSNNRIMKKRLMQAVRQMRKRKSEAQSSESS